MSARGQARAQVDVGWPAVRLAWWSFGVVAACLLGGLGFTVVIARGPHAVDLDEVLNAWLLWLAMFAFPMVGVLVASRQPRNPIGWVLLAIGLVWEGSALAEGYVYYGLVTAPGSVPRPDLVAVATSSSWVPGIGLIGTFLLLLFPDGVLPSRRWRPFAWFAACVLLALTVMMPLLPAPLSEVVSDGHLAARPSDVANPLGVAALEPVLDAIFVLVALIPLCIVGSTTSLIVRYRRSVGQERLQLKWLAAAAAVTAAIYFATMLASLLVGSELWAEQVTPVWLRFLQQASVPIFALIPVAIGVAILRHRLFEIDRLVSRTVTYAIVVVAIAGTYLTAIGGLTRVLPNNNDLAVAASTLVAAAVFRPLQRRVRRAADRRFNRARFDTEREVADFGRTLRDQIDPMMVTSRLLDVIARTVQPASAHLWTRPRTSDRRSA